tara:strand:+ start:2012 stop:3064 length:1053 start_codon:yes stop_codon:yes gene_type:complete
MNNNNNRTRNAFMNISSALDELVGGPPAPNPSEIISAPSETIQNPIPSAPPQIGDEMSAVFNPTALTVNIPTAEVDGIVDISGGMFGEIESDSETSEEDSAVTFTQTVEHIPNNTPMAPMAPMGMRFNGMNDLIEFLRTNHPNALNEDDDTDDSSGNETSSSLNEERECGICYNKIGIDKIVNTRCGHTFCNDCFFRWMKGNVTCALCRKNFTSWRRHSNDQMNGDISAVTEMFNSSLRENVRLNGKNKRLIKENVKFQAEKNELVKSLVSTRNLIEYNRGYAKGLISIQRPEYTGNYDFDKGLMKGYEEFREGVYRDKKKRRATRNYLPRNEKKKKAEEKSMFVFHGSD